MPSNSASNSASNSGKKQCKRNSANTPFCTRWWAGVLLEEMTGVMGSRKPKVSVQAHTDPWIEHRLDQELEQTFP